MADELMKSLTRLVFVSQAAVDISLPQVRALVAKARISNRRQDITGVLIFTGSHFLQVLEGREEPVNRMLTLIKTDSRHHQMKIISHESVSARDYAQWSLAFALNDLLEKHLVGLIKGSESFDESLVQSLLTTISLA